MDNITHSLIGAAIGRVVGEKAAKRFPDIAPERLGFAFFWASVISNNSPDFDFLMRPFAEDVRLSYLIHHRGITHTFLLSPVMALISAGIAGGLCGLSLKKKKAWIWLLATSWAGSLIHILADFGNDYGIHPVTPFWNQWFYGDSIFIVEPLGWLCLLPFAYFQSRTGIGRGVTLILTALILGLSAALGAAPPLVMEWLLLWAAVFFGVQYREPANWKIPAAGVALVLTLFISGSRAVKSKFEIEPFSNRFPPEKVHDVATTPAPANPFCWRTLVLSETQDGAYYVKVGVVSLLPDFFDPETCYFRMNETPTVPLRAVVEPQIEGVHWKGEFQGSWQKLDELSREYCKLRIFRGFARVPFWQKGPDGILGFGDVRYDYEKGLGFAEFMTTPDESCPSLPSLIPPYQTPSERKL